MAKLDDIINRYQQLRDYCDAFWDRVYKKYAVEFACAPGCATCCELPSVNYLEAYLMAGIIETGPQQHAPTRAQGPCPFLANDRCTVYASRPLICRTHGLLLKSETYSYALTVSCPFNFTRSDTGAIDPAYVLAIDKISDNLARLNAAFCLLNDGTVKKAADRVLLRDLASGAVNRDTLFNRERK
jgi:Fe-S-cluster containining protein